MDSQIRRPYNDTTSHAESSRMAARPLLGLLRAMVVAWRAFPFLYLRGVENFPHPAFEP
jgi:hypothetical protein